MLEQGSFVGSLWVAVILCLVRLAGIWGGCWLGCWLGATPVDHRKHMWYGMITQVSLIPHLIPVNNSRLQHEALDIIQAQHHTVVHTIAGLPCVPMQLRRE